MKRLFALTPMALLAACGHWRGADGGERPGRAGGDRPEMKLLLILPAVALLAACATGPGGLAVEDAAPAGTLVALGQPVGVGRLVATPVAVVEDSRCPAGVQCVWAGRLIVATRIDGPGWRETVPLRLGERHETHGSRVTLVSGVPERKAEGETPAASYRFAYEGGE